MAMLADGGFVIGYHQSPIDGRDFEVMVRRFNPPGVINAPEFQMNTYIDSLQKNVRITAGPEGYFAVWQSYYQDGDDSGVFGRSYDATYGISAEEFMVSETGDGKQEYPTVAAGQDGRFVAVWHQEVSPNVFQIRSRIHLP